ncbi:MAG: pilin [Patescibacteria group bacterium]
MKKILLTFLFAFLFLATNVKVVFADNDTLGVYCDVTVNGVALSSTQDSAPTIYASRKDGANYVYPFKVCGNLALLNNLPTGVKPVIDMTPYHFDFTAFQPSERINLTQDGSCLVGEYSKNLAPNGKTVDSVYDVEGDNSGNTPICHRVFARLAPSVLADTAAWANASTMCGTIGLDPVAPIHNDNVTIDFVLPEPFWTNAINSPEGISYSGLHYKLIRSADGAELQNGEVSGIINGGLADPHIFEHVDHMDAGNYRVKFVLEGSNGNLDICERSFDVGTQNDPGKLNDSVGSVDEFKLCNQAGPPGSDSYTACNKCFYNNSGIWTGVGCIPYTNTALMVRALIVLGLGIAGTAVVLMTLAGAFLMSTSRGEPQRVEEAKSLITSAVAGIFFIIFSVSILQFIGVSILHIPGFG